MIIDPAKFFMGRAYKELKIHDQNVETSREEVKFFLSKRPDRYVGYIKWDPTKRLGKFTTWMGDTLGTIVRSGDPYHVSGFGGSRSTRVPIRVIVENGCIYSGTYFESSGDYARIKKMKRSV